MIDLPSGARLRCTTVLKASSRSRDNAIALAVDLPLIVAPLIRWYRAHARPLPWRSSADPYGIWISEIMLQQTQVATVIPYWQRWMERLPDVPALAKAKPSAVLKLWEGLGYYSRARHLQAAARCMEQKHEAKVPDRLQDLLAMPGIGRYTAGAIRSIAFDQPEPVLDGNVMRVLTRLFRFHGDPRANPLNRALWQLAADLVQTASRKRRRGQRPCSDLNQSLMELGALLCLPVNPRCGDCPVQPVCGAYLHQDVDKLPSPRRPTAYRKQRIAAFVLQNGNRFFVRRRPSHGVNSRLWEFPCAEFFEKRDIAQLATQELGAAPSESAPFLTIHHAITNRRITTEAYRVTLGPGSPDPIANGKLCTMAQLQRLTFPSAHRQIVDHLSLTTE